MICGFTWSEVSSLQSVKPPAVWVEDSIFDEDIKDEQVKRNDVGKYVDSSVYHFPRISALLSTTNTRKF